MESAPVPRLGTPREAALADLADTAARLRELLVVRDQQLDAARALGASWGDLGRALGVSPQAAQQRHRRAHSAGVTS